MSSKPTSTNDVVKKYLPFRVSDTPFTRYSSFPTNTERYDQQTQNVDKKKLIVSATYSDFSNSCFQEFFTDDETNAMHYKSFENDYNKKFAHLKYSSLWQGDYLSHSYLIENNKYLVVFKDNDYYDVYDMDKDKWLVDHKCPLGEKVGFKSRSIMINDEIIIASGDDLCGLRFYYMGNKHITNPITIYSHYLQTPLLFAQHGMCVIAFKKLDTNLKKSKNLKNELLKTFELKIILFGGSWNDPILSSFLILDILIDCDYSKNWQSFPDVDISIDETLIDWNKIKLTNMGFSYTLRKSIIWKNFGYECIFNDKNEAIIIVIGGFGKWRQDIHLFNCVTYELASKQKVKLQYKYQSNAMY